MKFKVFALCEMTSNRKTRHIPGSKLQIHIGLKRTQQMLHHRPHAWGQMVAVGLLQRQLARSRPIRLVQRDLELTTAQVGQRVVQACLADAQSQHGRLRCVLWV